MLAFASFRMYPKQRVLQRDRVSVAIGGRAFDILLALVLRAGTVVSVNDLMSYVWPNITVEEANLRVQMGVLRKVLSQCEGSVRAIETIPLRGYCFVLPVAHYPDGIEVAPERSQGLTLLPTVVGPIVGRDDVIEVILAALNERRFVTITGPGGIGKTTVAIATANRYASDFQGTITFIDLSRVADGERATAVIAEALGIETNGNILARLRGFLRTRNVLLVLDTCEHIVEPVARLAETLISFCANLRLLITSREALRATGEWVHRLPPLTFPEDDEATTLDNVESFTAITLFVDRVRSAMRYEVLEKDLQILSEICRRLDGIPLALEFAAARVCELGLREIATHLDDRFIILNRGRRTALPRHQTLSATLDWSYSLLSPDEQRMLRKLASLDGSFSADAAVAAGSAAGCERPPDALSGLFEKSLLSVEMRNDAAPVYKLLDTTRAYMRQGSEPNHRHPFFPDANFKINRASKASSSVSLPKQTASA